jgi:hypothetical protein
MSLGNQRTKPNQKSNTTGGALISPVSPAEFSDFLGLDYNAGDDVLLNSFLLAVCEWYIAQSSSELLSREWVLKFDRYPSISARFTGLSPVSSNFDAWIDIPLYPVTLVSSITVDAVAETFTSDLDSKPPRVFFESYGENIEVTYTAGYALAADIPANVILGINMMAGYLYEHRGACDIGNAAKESGANSIWGISAMVLSL